MNLRRVQYDELDSRLRGEIDAIRHASFDELRKIYVLARPEGGATPHGIGGALGIDAEWLAVAVLFSGSAVAYFEYRRQDNVLAIKSLCVATAMRRRGILRQLLEQLSAEYKTAMSLWCVEHTGNQAIFARVGFHLQHAEISPYFTTPDGRPIMEYQMLRPFVPLP